MASKVGPFNSAQVPRKFFDDGTYLGTAGWTNVQHGPFYQQSFIAYRGNVTILPRLFGPDAWAVASAIDVTSTGTAVAYEEVNEANGPITKVATYHASVTSVLPSPSGFCGYPVGIADNGDVAGWMYSGTSYRAIAWIDGQFTELPRDGLPSICTGVSADGTMYGSLELPNGAGLVPVKWKNGVRSEVAGYQGAKIQKVSKGGVVAGSFYDPSIGQARVFVLKDGKVTVMAREERRPYGLHVVDVNDLGTVLSDNLYDLGEQYAIYKNGRPYLWPNVIVPNGDYWPGLPRALNNRDEVIGTSYTKDLLNTRFFIARPVPEPATMGALALGLSCLAARRRAKRR